MAAKKKTQTFELDLADQCHIDALDYLAASLVRNGRPDEAEGPRKLAADANTVKTEEARRDRNTEAAQADVDERRARDQKRRDDDDALDEGD